MEKAYAQALFSLSKKEGANPDEIVRMLTSHLTSTGRLKLLPHILKELKRIDARAESFGEVLEVASLSDKKEAHARAKELGIETEPVVNTSLITGWRARKGSRVIDRSGKRALLDLYGRVVAATR